MKVRKGFTLIELLIVIAIIAILAAIAIPQFAKYRIRAYNGAAESDLRNARTTEEAFFADWQTYGATDDAVISPDSVVISDGVHTETFTLSARVGIQINCDNNYTSYVMVTKHTNGDTYYGADSDVQGIYFNKSSDYVNENLDSPSITVPGSNPQQPDFGTGWTLQ